VVIFWIEDFEGLKMSNLAVIVIMVERLEGTAMGKAHCGSRRKAEKWMAICVGANLSINAHCRSLKSFWSIHYVFAKPLSIVFMEETCEVAKLEPASEKVS
jgi:hypothetical protein